MRIAEFCVGRARTDSSNGVELTVFRLSEALAASNHALTICLSEKPAIAIPGASVHNFPPARRLLPIPPALIGLLRDWKPDIVHLHSVYTFANTHLAWILRRQDIPYIVTPHGGYGRANELHRGPLKRLYRFAFELAMLNGAEFIHSVGDTADIVRYGSESDVVETTKGLDLPDRATEGMTTEPNPAVSTSEFRFGFLGRLDPLHKGLDLLIQAFAASDLADSSLTLVGPTHGTGRDELERLAESQGVSDRVIFTGPMVGTDKDRIMETFHAFIHVSRWEGGIPYAVIEAAAHSLPLLLTPQADPNGGLHQAGASLEVDDSVESIRRGLIALRHLPTERLRQMGEIGREYVTSVFSWERMSDELVAALRTRGVGS